MIGQKLGHYHVIDRLGGGGMGVIYRAEDTRLGRMVALKFLPLAMEEDPLALERFRREAKTISALNHPNICTLYDVGEENGRPFLVMELLEGQTLKDRIASGPIPLAAFLEFAIQVADSLDAAHGKGIIHRDIKPENIFITTREQAKVLDFGLAKPGGIAAPSASGVTVTMVHTSAGTAVGTVNYMSPEQARGLDLDGRTDIFSFGLTMYEMAARRMAFDGPTMAVIFDALLNHNPAPVHTVDVNLPEDLSRIIDRCIAKDLDQRYGSAAELLADLRSLRQRMFSGAISATRIPVVREEAPVAPAKGVPWRLVIGGVAILVVAAGAYLLWTEPEPVRRTEVTASQLTNNAAELAVTGAAVSPDGATVAFSDPAGIHLLQGKDAKLLSGTANLTLLSWPGKDRMLASVKAGEVVAIDPASGNRQPSRMEIPAPKGAWVLFEKSAGDWWLQRASDPPVPAFQAEGSLDAAAWFPDGQRFLYRTSDGALKLFDIEKNNTKPFALGMDCAVRSLIVAPDKRLLYTCSAPDAQRGLWAVPLNFRQFEVAGAPQRVLVFDDIVPSALRASLDGRKIVYRRVQLQSDIYAGAPAAARRLELNLVEAHPGGFTPDGGSVVFGARRGDRYEIYRADVGGGAAKVLAALNWDRHNGLPTVSGDGKWAVVREVLTDRSRARQVRIPIGGGSGETVFSFANQGPELVNQCGAQAGSPCIQIYENGERLAVELYEPSKDSVRALFELEKGAQFPAVSLDTAHIAYLIGQRLKVVSLNGTKEHDIELTPDLRLANLSFTADGQGVYAESTRKEDAALVRVDFKGGVRTEWVTKMRITGIRASRDGKSVALGIGSTKTNVWLAEMR